MKMLIIGIQIDIWLLDWELFESHLWYNILIFIHYVLGLDAKNIEDIGHKVAEALKKFRNDDKFQVSLSSEFQTKSGGNFQTDETRNFSLGTDLDGTDNLTESRFIQGLENSLENLLTTNNDDDEN